MTPTVRLTLSARPENVALVRELIAAVAEVVETGRSRDDIRAAVSEAANNVVVHAYRGAEGPLEVTVRMLQAALEVTVRDQGFGIASRESAETAASELMAERGPGHGLGIAVMDALADRFELRPREPHGVEAVLRFALSAQWRLDGAGEDLHGGVFEPVGRDQVAVAMSPAELGSVVLPRLVCAAAARAGFTVDRMSDAQLLADALAAHVVPALRGAVLRSRLEIGRRELAIEVGAFDPGGGRAVIADSNVGQLGPLLERLASSTEVYDSDSGELLELSIRDERQPAAPLGGS
jgi:serine/threonine-protein kinase RsbW